MLTIRFDNTARVANCPACGLSSGRWPRHADVERWHARHKRHCRGEAVHALAARSPHGGVAVRLPGEPWRWLGAYHKKPRPGQRQAYFWGTGPYNIEWVSVECARRDRKIIENKT